MDIVKEEAVDVPAIKMEPDVELVVPEESESMRETEWNIDLLESGGSFLTLLPRPGSAVGDDSDCDELYEDDPLYESDDESDDESPKKKVPQEPKIPKCNWINKGKFSHSVSVPDDDLSRSTAPDINPDDIRSPVKFFELFFDEKIVALILEQTNLYLKSKYKRDGDFSIAKREMLDFLTIELYMGCVRMPSYSDYWSKSLRFDRVADLMAKKRYELIRRHLHFSNNSSADPSDRYCKIRDLFDRIRTNFLTIPNTTRQSIEKITVPYNSVHATDRELYLPDKPPKEGFKIFARCASDGFISDMLFHDGADTFKRAGLSSAENNFEFGEKVVVSLCRTLPDPKSNFALRYDDWASSVQLMTYLKNNHGIQSLCLIKESKLGPIGFPSDKRLKQMGTGSMAHKFDDGHGIAATKWLESDVVVIATTYVPHEISTIDFRDWKTFRKATIPCPRAIKEFEKGSRINDKELFTGPDRPAYYRCHKYYLTIFRLLLNMCIRNAWILYKRHVKAENEKRRTSGAKDLKAMSLAKFRSCIASDLENGKIGQYGRSDVPPSSGLRSDPRFDGISHWPDFGSEGRCEYCRSFTPVFCTKCKVRICVVRNCFYNYHQTEEKR
ncbi:unnamed protein product [Nesidiocoris tenuis]|uniref:PiggyBac transposable element-derived protein domain-containing protein n=1 Tax=Nesidiocoris tenuis TaxID=355587 RepID=A0A6H5GUH8_9HEMI|nr:unnamed protein product [Nesidiocoris tenuis]